MEIIGISPNLWDSQWMNRQHMMWALRKHARVLYVQEPESWARSWHSRDERTFRPRITTADGALSVLQLPKILSRRHSRGFWDATTFRLKSRMIEGALGRSPRPRVLYLWNPELLAYAKSLSPDVLVYHLYDMLPNYIEPQFAGSLLQKQFQEICRVADIVLAGTARQAEAIPAKQVVVLPNAVQLEWYTQRAAEPDDLKGVGRPRIGYIGSLTGALDWEWFEALASNREWQLVLGGPAYSLSPDDQQTFERLQTLPNVHYVGLKPARAVPGYMQHLDLGLLPYRRGGHQEWASVIKVNEYCAAALPVVGTPLAGLRTDPDASRFVQFVDTAAEAVAAVREALHSGLTEEERTLRLEFAARNSWDRRAEVVMGLIRERESRPLVAC